MAAFYTPGRYRARIVKQVLTENRKGNPEFQLTVLPIGYYEKEEYVQYDFPYTRTIYLTLTEGTIGTADKPGWIMETLRYLGFNGYSFEQLNPEARDAINFADHEIDVLCLVGDYEGKEREKWSIRREGSVAKPMEKKGVRSLDAKFKNLLAAKPKKGKADPESDQEPAGVATATASPPTPQTEDIPF